MWFDKYKAGNDKIRRGPQALGLDFTFKNNVNLFGFPEHANSFNLRDTYEIGDPYRLYNLDISEN